MEADVDADVVDQQMAQQLEQMHAQQDVMATLDVLRNAAKVSYPVLDTTTN